MTTIHFSTDLLFGSQIANAARAVNVTLEQIGVPEELRRRVAGGDIQGILIDLNAPLGDLAELADLAQLVAELRQAAPSAIRVLAYGPHVHTHRLNEAEQAGCDQVFTRGQLHRELAGTLQRLDSAEPDTPGGAEPDTPAGA